MEIGELIEEMGIINGNYSYSRGIVQYDNGDTLMDSKIPVEHFVNNYILN